MINQFVWFFLHGLQNINVICIIIIIILIENKDSSR